MKKLEEIIKEIEELNNDYINTCLDDDKYYEQFKNNTLDENAKKEFTKEYFDYEAESAKKDAINFITRKYEEISKNSASTEFDYEIAYYKTFQQYFNIVKDEKKMMAIDLYLKATTEHFFEKLSEVYTN